MAKTITVEIHSTIEIPTTIEIPEVPEGKKAIWKDGKVVFEDITPKLPETWEEFLSLYPIKEGECYIDNSGNINTFKSRIGNTRNPLYDLSVLPSQEAAESHIALIQLHQLRDCYRQGWKPNWCNRDSSKYSISFCGNCNDYIISPCWYSRHFLAFQSYELAEKFLKCFRNLIVQAGDLL